MSNSSIGGLGVARAAPTTFGFIIPQRGSLFGLGPVRSLLKMSEQADQCGLFDTIWVGDSLTAKFRPESITCLGALAGMTEHVRLAVGCMGSFPLRDPALFALQWATLDQISGGRTLLSVCTGIQLDGGSVNEGQNFGGYRNSDRAGLMEENLEICRKLWTGEEIEHDGRYHHYERLQMIPRPIQDPIPVWITANPRPSKHYGNVLRRIATISDGFMTNYSGKENFAALLGNLGEALDEAGKAWESFQIGLYHNVNIGPSRADCLQATKAFCDRYYLPGHLDAWLDNMTVAGTVDECVDQLARLSSEGIDHIALRITSFDQQEQLKVLLGEVLPAASECINEASAR